MKHVSNSTWSSTKGCFLIASGYNINLALIYLWEPGNRFDSYTHSCGPLILIPHKRLKAFVQILFLSFCFLLKPFS